MQQRIERMQKIVELAQQELDEAATVFRSLEQQYESEQAQLVQLRQYLSEYIEQQTSGEGSTLQQLKSTNAFMDKLNKAINHQVEQIQQTDQSVQEAREIWVEKRVREQALVKLTEKLQSKHSQALSRVEQKMLDELSALKFASNTSKS